MASRILSQKAFSSAIRSWATSKTPQHTPRFHLRHLTSSPRLFKDPWMLPNTPEHELATQSPPDLPALPPLPRPNETVDKLRARLVYQSRKRGTLESDLLLSTFAGENLSGMSEEDLKEYDKLLDEPDWDIYYWSTGKRTPPERWVNSSILKRLQVHAKNEGKAVRRMPELSEDTPRSNS